MKDFNQLNRLQVSEAVGVQPRAARAVAEPALVWALVPTTSLQVATSEQGLPG